MALKSPSSSSAHPFSSSSIRYPWKYDVFISFRGQDTRRGFTGNLYKALGRKGIHTFFDDGELQSGEEITPALLKAIEESRIAIVVLSPNYASSSFCLEELVHILDCIKGNNRFVLPVFFNVDPSDLRRLKNNFGEAMTKHEKRYKDHMNNKVDTWKKALEKVANLSGYHFKDWHGYEHQFIEKIVKDVSRKIRRVLLPVADYTVGLESRVSEVISLLEMDSDDGVLMVGIHGIGGIGKTTLALAIYNSIAHHFDGMCFLENVRENSQKYGLVFLQNNLLCKILGREEVQIVGVKEGNSQIQQRLRQKRVLLILDDIDEHEQLKAIAGKPDWFGRGSRIIITTRNKHLLTLHGIERTYEVQGLNKEESLDLLIWKAFKTDIVSPRYVNVLTRAVSYASGLPLALEVIGSNLFGKEVEHWESALHQCEKIPKRKIQQILKISYDALEEYEKNIFLDITCCLKGQNLIEIRDILHAHYGGDNMRYHIQRLVDKSLIKIKVGDQVTFHDLIEDMGKEIVRQESPNMPGKRSRLWSHDDIVQVLEENQGTETIEMIFLEFPLQKRDENEDSTKKEKNKLVQVEWDGKAFKRMKNLKTLIIKNGCFSKRPKYLPNSLRMMEWWGYPSKRFPSDSHPKKLSILKLPNYLFNSCKLDSLSKRLVSLNVLNFDNSNFLEEIPDVSSLVALQKLSFSGCKNLIRVHGSVGGLNHLKVLKAEDCQSLRTFPSINLPSLEILMLSYCSNLEKFPEVKGKMKNVAMLHLSGTKIKDLPLSFQNLCGLSSLSLCGKDFPMIPSVIVKMPKLSTVFIYKTLGFNKIAVSVPWASPSKVEEGSSSNISNLVLSQYRLSDDFFPLALAWFRNVKTLDLSLNNFTILPECIQYFRFLSSLRIDQCPDLKKIEGVPPNLKRFSAVSCKSLLTPSGTSVLLNQEVHENGNTEFALPGECIPNWFEHRKEISISFWLRGTFAVEESSISFWFRGRFPAKDLCLAILLKDWFRWSHRPRLKDVTTIVSINGKQVSRGRGRTKMEKLYIFDLSVTNKMNHLDEICFENEWNHAKVSFELEDADNMEIGMHILKQKSSGIMEDIRFTDPYRKRKRDDEALNSIAQVMEGEGSTSACPRQEKKTKC